MHEYIGQGDQHFSNKKFQDFFKNSKTMKLFHDFSKNLKNSRTVGHPVDAYMHLCACVPACMHMYA